MRKQRPRRVSERPDSKASFERAGKDHSCPSSSLGTHLSPKLCFADQRSTRRSGCGCASGALSKRSFADTRVPKPELGHE